MAEAFRCELCDEIYMGEPAKKLYERGDHSLQGTNYKKVADVCAECWRELEEVNDD
jgi:hypothetical protein